jgi:hypothetical protein
MLLGDNYQHILISAGIFILAIPSFSLCNKFTLWVKKLDKGQQANYFLP